MHLKTISFDHNVLHMGSLVVFVFCPQLQCEHSFTFTSYIISWCLMRMLSCHQQKARPSSHLQPIAWGEVAHGSLWLAERSPVCLQASSMSVCACPAAHMCLCEEQRNICTPNQKPMFCLHSIVMLIPWYFVYYYTELTDYINMEYTSKNTKHGYTMVHL